MSSSFASLKHIFCVVCCICAFTVFIITRFHLPTFPNQAMFYAFPNFPFYNFDPTPTTKILIWVPRKHTPSAGSLGRIRILMEQLNQKSGEVCREQQNVDDNPVYCQFSMIPEDVEQADAVGYYMFNIAYRQPDLPQIRMPDQLWIAFIQESPSHSAWVDPYKYQMNWTMSYRMDSDLWAPYGRKMAKSGNVSEPIMISNYTLENWISGKTKLVAGVISHCGTPAKREVLIHKMNETGILVDIFGSCGNKPMCSLVNNYNRHCDQFWLDFAKTYKFFLAYENSLCVDYITEKFWRSLQIGVVPVVYGSANYTGEAPPNSFINARDYKSAKELMLYLKRLDEDDKEYAKYFEWRREYDIEEKMTWHRAWCNACKAVRDHKQGVKRLEKSYPNLKEWWHHLPNSNSSACEKAPNFV